MRTFNRKYEHEVASKFESKKCKYLFVTEGKFIFHSCDCIPHFRLGKLYTSEKLILDLIFDKAANISCNHFHKISLFFDLNDSKL